MNVLLAATPYEFSHPLVTDRLRVRSMTTADIDDVTAYQSREDVCRYLLHGPRARDEVAAKVSEWSAATRLAVDGDYLQLAIDLDGRVIGNSFLRLASAENRQGEIGWTLHPDFVGHGYAAEASSAMLDLAFGPVAMHRVRAELDPRNDASVALCGRLGMRHEAHFVQDLWFKGEWADTGVYGILAGEWLARSRGAGA